MKGRIASCVLLFLLIGIWEVLCRIIQIPVFILPAPSRIVSVAIFQAPLLAHHALITCFEILLGVALSVIVAIPMSILMFASPLVEQALSPLLIASQAIPVFALAPLLIIWLGYGIWSKVCMAALIIFFPITVNLLEGFKSCDSDYDKLFTLMGASFPKRLRYLYWPWALPYFFAGLKVGVSVATIGAVIGEWVGAQSGLGYLMIQWNPRLRVDMVFAAILWLTIIGISLWSIVSFLNKKVITWNR